MSKTKKEFQALEKRSNELIGLMLDNIETKLARCKCKSRCKCGSQELEDMLNELREIQQKMEKTAPMLHLINDANDFFRRQ